MHVRSHFVQHIVPSLDPQCMNIAHLLDLIQTFSLSFYVITFHLCVHVNIIGVDQLTALFFNPHMGMPLCDHIWSHFLKGVDGDLPETSEYGD